MNKKNEIYEKESYRKNAQIEKIENSFSLQTNSFGIIKKYLKLIIICLIIFTILLVIASIPILPMYLMIIILLISVIFFNNYKIIAKDKKITIVQDMQEIILDYSQIKNVYIERYVTRIFFKKLYSYNIIIIYKTIKGKFLDITLPTLFLDIEQIEKFLSYFVVKKIKKNYIEMARKNKTKRKIIKGLLFVLFLIFITVTYLVQN